MMKYKEYIAKIEFDDSAGLFHGEVLNLRDVITFAGKTVGDLRIAFRDSVDDSLKFCKAQSAPVKPFKNVTFLLIVAP